MRETYRGQEKGREREPMLPLRIHNKSSKMTTNAKN
jgi:hypothetical protein